MSIVTQDSALEDGPTPARGLPRYSMTVEAKEGRRRRGSAKDEAAWNSASRMVPGSMSVRSLHITWAGRHTLKVDTDAGCRRAVPLRRRSVAARATARTWQGVSAAEWQASATDSRFASLLVRLRREKRANRPRFREVARSRS